MAGGLVGGWAIGSKLRSAIDFDAQEQEPQQSAQTVADSAPQQAKTLMEATATVMLVGDPAAGKSLFVERCTNRDGIGRETLPRTLAPAWESAFMPLPLGRATFHFLDTPGAYPELSVPFYRGVQFVVLVFDVSNANSFVNLKMLWYTAVQTHRLNLANARIKPGSCVVLAHIIDERRERAVTRRDAARWCASKQLPYFETHPAEAVPKVLSHIAQTCISSD